MKAHWVGTVSPAGVSIRGVRDVQLETHDISKKFNYRLFESVHNTIFAINIGLSRKAAKLYTRIFLQIIFPSILPVEQVNFPPHTYTLII